MPKKQKRQTYKGDRELVSLFGVFVSLIIGYFVAEAALAKYIHPVHRITAFAIAGIGYLVAFILYARRPQGRG